MTNLENELRRVDASETLVINEQSRLLQSEGRRVYRFGFGQSPFSPPQQVIEAFRACVFRHEYMSVQGLESLRDSCARFHSKFLGVEIDSDDIYIGPGSKQMIFTVMQCFKDADVILPGPSWVSYEPQADLIGHHVVRVPTSFDERWRLTPERLEEAIVSGGRDGVPKIVLFNYPGNPDGLTYAADELRALASVCRHHDVIVISDEIYGLLHHQGAHVSIAAYYPEKTFVTTGLSKWCGAGGWRLGVLIAPSAMRNSMHDTLIGIASETYSTVAAPIQLAAELAYADYDAIQPYIQHQRRICSVIGQWVASELRRVGCRVHNPEGGFYLYPDFSVFQPYFESKGLYTSAQMCQWFLEHTGVVVLPGAAFGVEHSVFTARLAYVDFDGNQALRISESVGLDAPYSDELVRRFAPKVVEGIGALTDFLLDLK